jgi:hypothetical protein
MCARHNRSHKRIIQRCVGCSNGFHRDARPGQTFGLVIEGQLPSGSKVVMKSFSRWDVAAVSELC